ncbi:leucyl aminopeptidase family protein [Corynebacterium resistens]|uniref:leucyl aminopeptidase family protein n=1 Tax=Corynebacterium resistens TaxID=258224 RepID=UPI002355EAE6|nr:leucyl aminopeptidase family protein [Corynebacterium resistens]
MTTAPIPSIPQKVAEVTAGERLESSEIIEVAIVSSDAASSHGLTIQADGSFVYGLSESQPALLDLSHSKDFHDDGWRKAGAEIVRRLDTLIQGHPVRAKKHLVQVSVPEDATADNLRSLAIGLTVGNHTFVTTNKRRKPRVRRVHIVLPGNGKSATAGHLENAVTTGARLGAATCLARDLSNAPSNVKSPEWFARQAKKAVNGIEGVKVRIRDEEWLQHKGFGGILAVGEGSSRPPRLVELVWDPERVGQKRRRKTVVLVGKGVTFDTGGISIKPSANMDSMRTDMTGGASVLAAFQALAEMQVPRKIVALIPMAENMPSATAFRPGDVVEHYGGLTSEIVNTDAEGRLLLADAVSYGARKHKPAAVVSIATLTGAAKIALGLRTGAVFAPDWGVGVKLARRGATVGERWWPMPLPDYHEDDVDSKVADLRQCPPGPGATTAAMFVRRFTRGVAHVHLDIAGPGRAESTYDEVTPLGTGFGARTLIQWLSR